MEPNKILSANILDLIFDDRNKEYGAYELRVTYPERIKKSLIFVFAIAGLALTGVALANKLKPEDKTGFIIKELTLETVKPDEPELLPDPIKKPEPQTRTEQFTTPVIVKQDVVDPPPTQEDLVKAIIGEEDKGGVDDDGGITEVKNMDGDKGIIEKKDVVSDEPFRSVEVDAKFDGNWERFLLKNLNPNTPIDNGAPAGKYKIIIQFVVDLEGNVSDIKALTNHGYGLEQEAIRVLKKATKWIPANQNGRPVKAYRIQPIIFEVPEE
jgi:periplasmic protein TonB